MQNQFRQLNNYTISRCCAIWFLLYLAYVIHEIITEKHRKHISKYRYFTMTRLGVEDDGREKVVIGFYTSTGDRTGILTLLPENIEGFINNENENWVYYISNVRISE